MDEIIKVYAKLDNYNSVIEINSSIFLSNVEEYVEIDTSEGKENRDKYAHAQGNYLEKGVFDEQERPNYKLINNTVIELSEEEKAELYPASETEEVLTLEKLKEEQEMTNQALQDLALMLLGGI